MYKSILNMEDTQVGIKIIKDNFEKELAKSLNLIRVSAPLFVTSSSNLNDSLTGKEKPVSFKVKGIDDTLEIVHSLAKWKREAIYRYNILSHQGIYTDMNAIRKNEELDNIHSLYVDQWDFEIKISREDRNLNYLFNKVKTIYKVILKVEDLVHKKYPVLKNNLNKDIKFISTSELYSLYPTLDKKEREAKITKKYGSIFLYQIGWDLVDNKPHEYRAPDYDDWNLNGDLIVYDKIIDGPIELSSMGIRVDKESIISQLKKRNKEELLVSDYTKKIINNVLPLTYGGGIGQSRLCMLFLEKMHIGEVQASIWTEKEKEKAKKGGYILL